MTEDTRGMITMALKAKRRYRGVYVSGRNRNGDACVVRKATAYMSLLHRFLSAYEVYMLNQEAFERKAFGTDDYFGVNPESNAVYQTTLEQLERRLQASERTLFHTVIDMNNCYKEEFGIPALPFIRKPDEDPKDLAAMVRRILDTLGDMAYEVAI